MNKHQANFMRILGNAEEELVLLVEGEIKMLDLNLNNVRRMRRTIGKSAAKRIIEICEDYLVGNLPCNKND